MDQKIIKEGLTYRDVLLVPQRSAIPTRKLIDTSSYLTRNIKLKIPIVSANMDTVTEYKMAIAMARMGGIGVIHRFMTIEQEAKEVEKVKRSESYRIDTPYSILPDKTLGEARQLMKRYGVSGLLVVDESGRLEGILTRRDEIYEHDEFKLVRDLMTPKERLIVAYENIELQEAKKILAKHRIEKLPLVNQDNHLVGLITSKDIIKTMEYPNATKDDRGRLRVVAAIGTKEDALDRAKALQEAGADALVIDIAHGHSEMVINTLELLKNYNIKIPIIAGNVATPEAVRDLIAAGADAIKVGVGPGSTCITRLVAGVGVPQFTAVLECAREAEKHGIPIIADGGVAFSGDIAKAIGAGASIVMLGSLLGGTDESPGITLTKKGRKYKVSRGMASLGANINREANKNTENSDYVAEGVEAMVPYRGSVAEILNQLVGGLKSGMSYSNAMTVIEMWQNARFCKITDSGWAESKPHDVEVI
ncbi:MAG: IMP dehydrogenase [Parcubacteria group bacterium CG10_big_fil_rev_8_21_14_0_10_36_14]|nr:MAG: IMP dehydrogenase [Parcubacteria group bacterium CG10_big_fil_rev_8_21_14_0_10_36_14]